MKKVLGFLPAGALAPTVGLLGACSDQPRTDDELDEDDAVETPGTVATQPTEAPRDAEGTVAMTESFRPAEGAKEGQRIDGTVTVFEPTEPNADYRLSVRIAGIGEGEHAWHIHAAPCGKEGPVVVPFTQTEDGPGLAQPLRSDAAGTAEATVTVPAERLTLEKMKSGEYSVHVHEKGGIDHGPTVACANL
jgi:Cu/Zn superoxide dismutase